MDIADLHPACTVPFADVALCLHPQDDVAIAKVALESGTMLVSEPGHPVPSAIVVCGPIPSGHKLALRPVAANEPVRRYGQVIGFATRPIAAGEHVHTHNLGATDFGREYVFGADVQPVAMVPEDRRRTFLGYRRPDGRVGTRNFIAVISSVNCSAHATREIAYHFTPERLVAFPNVDGVIALTHHSGCSFPIDGPDHVLLQRTLAGMALHPNVGAYLLVGLGCETNECSALVRKHDLERATGVASPYPLGLLIQDHGGVRKTVQAGIAAVQELLPVVNGTPRTLQPVSELMLALQCGGSDGWSGVTANPVVGLVADQVIRQGGTVLLGETPEIYGAEQLLLRRAVSPQVGQKLLAQVRWWEEYAQRMGFKIDNNPSPGNKAGGLTTIYEKSLGAIAKAGGTPLTGVYDYAERVTARGFCFMDTPGNDWYAVTGHVAGGCNLVLFTTGRGSVFGFKPAPTIKICSNSAAYARVSDDMDLNAGRVLEGEAIEVVAQELLELTVAVASGRASKSEAQGIGEAEFCPWSRWGVL
jgi:altronate hydrolase